MAAPRSSRTLPLVWRALKPIAVVVFLAAVARFQPWLSAAFTYDASSVRFRSHRPALPALSDFDHCRGGQGVLAVRAHGPARRRPHVLAAARILGSTHGHTLQPGFNLSGWTGSNGLTVSQAAVGLPRDAPTFGRLSASGSGIPRCRSRCESTSRWSTARDFGSILPDQRRWPGSRVNQQVRRGMMCFRASVPA